MGAFPIPSLESIHAQLVADYQNRFPNDDVSRRSDNWKRLRVNALAVLMLMHRNNVVYDELLPDTAIEKIDRHGQIHGVFRKPATIAHKADALRLVGTAASAFTLGTLLAHKDGTRFQLDESGTIPVGGFIDVDVEAIDAGPLGKKNLGEVLTFLAAPAGIQSTAELQKDIDEGGDDVEAIGAYRPRILDRIAFPGMGGNRNDYEEWMLSLPGVTTAYVWPLRQGWGTVDMAFLHGGRGAVRLPSALEIAAVQAFIDGERPVSVADCRVLTVVEEQQDLEALVAPFDDPQWRFDWDDTIPLVVSAFNATTRVLTFTAARPVDVDVKDRVIYRRTAAPFNDGSELVIEALGPGANDVIVGTLTAAQAAAPPVAGNLVYSGGPIVDTARQAILAYYDTLGPGRGAYAAGSWEDKLSVPRIFGALQSLPSVLDSTIITPAATVTPTNNAPAPTVGLITPRQIIIRRWH